MRRQGNKYALAFVATALVSYSSFLPEATAASAPLAAAAETQAARHGSVVIKRDDYGIPNIYADDTYSLFYGWGYALAEDRLFQIESTRRAALGLSAEVFGAEYLERDKQRLTNYDPELLKPQLAAVTGEHREALDGMVAGINARIRDVMADRANLMPKQFIDFGFEPQPWTDLNIAASWAGLLLIGFADNSQQVSNASLLAELKAKAGDEAGTRMFEALRWKSDPTAPVTVPKIDQDEGRAVRGLPDPNVAAAPPIRPISPLASAAQSRQMITIYGGDGPDKVPSASNTWLANGPKLLGADSVLVSGPQVGDQVPSMLWSASLHGAGINVTGLTYPGLPYFHYGTNEHIAWGRTALAGSLVDIYQEQLHPTDPYRYRHNGQWVRMTKRTKMIPVKGQAPVQHDMYYTVHGPVLVFDEANHTAYSKKRSWYGREIETMFAYYDEMKATNFDQWMAAISRKSNNQSQYYADKAGNIGYIQAGKYPIRPKGYNIQLPTIGDGSMEWKGIQPFESNARMLNPKQGYIANWNNRPSLDVLNSDTLLWSRMNRVEAITEQFDAKPRLTAQEIWDINRHSSVSSEQFRYFAPLISEALRDEPADSRLRQVANVVTGWNGQEDDPTFSGLYSSPGQTIYYEWLTAALKRFFSKDLPARYLNGCGQGPTYTCSSGQPTGASVLYFALTEGKTGSPLPGYDFLHDVTPQALIRAALQDADATLTAKFGADIKTWLTPTRPKVWRTNSPLGVPWSGPTETMSWPVGQNRGTMNAMYIFRNGTVSMCEAVPPGQSGFIAPNGLKDPNYENQFKLYTTFNCHPRWISDADVDKHTVSTRRLTF